jgi:hypothetical protein
MDSLCNLEVAISFTRMPVEQTIEETINKNTQIPDGAKGFNLKPGAVSK